MTNRHNLSFEICLDEFTGEFAAERTVLLIFDSIEKTKAAVFSKGGKIFDTKFSVPCNAENPLGRIANLEFVIATPYQCNASLMRTTVQTSSGGDVTVVDFDINFTET